jgi:hypothetical protein
MGRQDHRRAHRTASDALRSTRPPPRHSCRDRHSTDDALSGTLARVELGTPIERLTGMMRAGLALLVVLPLAVVGCSASHRKATPMPSTSTTVPRPVTASARCSEVLGRGVVSSATTTVAKVRATPIGLVGGRFRDAFRGLDGAQAAALCVLPAGQGCYLVTAVAANDQEQRLIKACGIVHGAIPSPASILNGTD